MLDLQMKGAQNQELPAQQGGSGMREDDKRPWLAADGGTCKPW